MVRRMVPATQTEDERLLRAAFAVAAESRSRGDHPFGALIADSKGIIIQKQLNGFKDHGNDRTAHAEALLATWAATHLSLEELQKSTLYTNAEPCAMCSGSIYWSGIGRVVYGQSEKSLKEQTGDNPENPTLDLPCRKVFEAGQRPTAVVGPMLEDEAKKLQEGFWDERD